MTLTIAFDPWRGGYEIRDDEGPLLVAHEDGHGGPRLVGITDPRQLPSGQVTLPFRAPSADGAGLRLDGRQLRIECGRSKGCMCAFNSPWKP